MIQLRRIMAILVASVYGLVSLFAVLVAVILASAASGSEHKVAFVVLSFLILIVFSLPWFLIVRWFRKISSDVKRISASIDSSKSGVEPTSVIGSVSHHMIYKDAGGAVTERDIFVINVCGKNTFTAYCHLRGAVRTFRYDRIIELVNVATGEVVYSNSKA